MNKKLAYMKVYTQKNKSIIAAYKRSIREIENARKRSPEYKERKNAWRIQKQKQDQQYAMEVKLYKQLGRAIRDRNLPRKNKSTTILVGCSIPDLIKHLEAQFLTGMSWDNRSEWHVDHIRHVSTFDLTKREQQLECFHFTNLRPLWALDNVTRRNIAKERNEDANEI